MSNISIKLFCIFIIIMYCLAPLSAIDLNQDNNNTLKELNDTSNDTIIDNVNEPINDNINDTINDNVNETINEDKMNFEIEKVNDASVETSTQICSIPSENHSLSTSPVDTQEYIDVEIDDINVGEKPVLTVHYDRGVYRMIPYLNYLSISCPQFSKDYSTNGKNGKGIITYEINEPNLEPGIYKVKIYYPGDKMETYYSDGPVTSFSPCTKYAEFHVKKNLDPKLNLNINNISQGEKLKVKITADEELNEYIQLKVNDGCIHTLRLKNGVGETSISGLGPGTYNATATFKGNYDFGKREVSTTFTVKGNDNPKALLNLHVDNIKLGEDAKLQIRSQDTLDDNVKIQIKGADGTKEMTVHVTGGVGETAIPDLKIGNYAAVAIFDGNDKFRPSENATTFTVNKQDPNMKIHVDNTSYGENAIIKIKANETFNSNVKVNLKGENDSKTVMINVKDGVGDASVANLMPETYSVDTTFDGNDTCNPDHASTSFNVEKAATDLSITTENIGTMSKLVKIHTKKIFSGDIKLKIKSENDYQEVTIKVVDGVGETTLSGLIPFDTYNATATFDGNEFFKPGSTSTTFKIQGRL